MAKYQIKAALLAPSGNYDETTDPKAVADFKALDKAYESDDVESMESILSNYELENGAIEEHDTNADLGMAITSWRKLGSNMKQLARILL